VSPALDALAAGVAADVLEPGADAGAEPPLLDLSGDAGDADASSRRSPSPPQPAPRQSQATRHSPDEVLGARVDVRVCT